MKQHFEDLSREWKAFFNKEENNVDQIYKDLTNELTDSVINKNHLDYIKIKATKGAGGAPNAPWIGIRDSRLTDRQSEGYSLVYLYSIDLERVYLSIAFGTGQFIEVFDTKKQAYEKMRQAASRIQSVFKSDQDSTGLMLSTIDLAATPKEYRQEGYEQSAIYSIEYRINNLPNDETLISDYNKMLNFYIRIHENPLTPTTEDLVSSVVDPIKVEDQKPIAKLFVPREPKKKKGKRTNLTNSNKKRRSDRSVYIGTKGEQVVFNYEKDKLITAGKHNLAKKVRWHASLNEKPGYDITSYDENEEPIYIEVKSASGKTINDVDITKREISAMLDKKTRGNYCLYLVTNALTKPNIEIIENPSEQLSNIKNFEQIQKLFTNMKKNFDIDLVTLNLSFRE